MNTQELKVIIVRQPKNYDWSQKGEISVDEISDLHWSREHGGYLPSGAKPSSAFSSLHGYIPYARAMELVDCSGAHDWGYNKAKICIPASLNSEGIYKQGYEYLKTLASNEKGIRTIRLNRPDGWPPCTKKILSVLAEHGGRMTRQELRREIGAQYRPHHLGYENTTICNAIKRLEMQYKITRTGKSYHTEIIELVNNE